MSDNPYRVVDWLPFDENDPAEAIVERERQAAHRYHIARLRHRKPDEAATFVGGAVALAAFFLTIGRGTERDELKLRLEAIMEASWIQACGIADGFNANSPSTDTRQ